MTVTCPVGRIPIRPHRTPATTLRQELSSLSYSSDLHLPRVELRSRPTHPAAPPIHPLADGPRRRRIRTSAAACLRDDLSCPRLPQARRRSDRPTVPGHAPLAPSTCPR